MRTAKQARFSDELETKPEAHEPVKTKSPDPVKRREKYWQLSEMKQKTRPTKRTKGDDWKGNPWAIPSGASNGTAQRGANGEAKEASSLPDDTSLDDKSEGERPPIRMSAAERLLRRQRGEVLPRAPKEEANRSNGRSWPLASRPPAQVREVEKRMPVLVPDANEAQKEEVQSEIPTRAQDADVTPQSPAMVKLKKDIADMKHRRSSSLSDSSPAVKPAAQSPPQHISSPRLLYRLLDDPAIASRLSLIIASLFLEDARPSFRFAMDGPSRWQLLLFAMTCKKVAAALQPRLYALVAMRTKDDIYEFLHQHVQRLADYVIVSSQTPCKNSTSFVHGCRRSLQTFDLHFPAEYSADARLQLLGALAEAKSLRQLRLHDVVRPLSIEALLPVLLGCRQLVVLDVEQLILPGPNSRWNSLSLVDLPRLAIIRLRFPRTASKNDTGALERILVPFANTIESFGIYDGEAVAWPSLLPMCSLWRIELHRPALGDDEEGVEEEEGPLTPLKLYSSAQSGCLLALKRVKLVEAGSSWSNLVGARIVSALRLLDVEVEVS